METDIREAIERSFGDGPPVPGAEDVLARGRVALRRRRLTEVTSALTVAVVAVVAAALATGGHPSSSTPPPAVSTMTTPTATPTTATDPSRPPRPEPAFPPAPNAGPIRDTGLPLDWAVAARPDGLHISSRVTVLRYVDDPWGARADGKWSVAVAYRLPGGDVVWWAGDVSRTGGGGSVSIPARYAGTTDFLHWVAGQKAGQYDRPRESHPPAPAGGWPGRVRMDLVRFAAPDTERLEPLDAVTLVAQRAHPDLPDSWAAAGDRSAAAEVRFEGARYYVLARSTATGDPQYVAVKAAKGGATLDDFLDLARHRYAEGGGGLL